MSIIDKYKKYITQCKIMGGDNRGLRNYHAGAVEPSTMALIDLRVDQPPLLRDLGCLYVDIKWVFQSDY